MPSTNVEIVLAAEESDDLGQLVIGHLSSKGFCVIDASLDHGVLDRAVKEALEADASGFLVRPPDLIVEGLLGSSGSSRISPLGDPTASHGNELLDYVGNGLKEVDQVMEDILWHVGPYLSGAGLECRARTHGLLHAAGTMIGAAIPLTEVDASSWLFQFMRGTIMCLVAVGPNEGTLKLSPFDGEAQAYTFGLAPGSMVLFRCDLMRAEFSCTGRGMLVSCFFLRDAGQTSKQDLLSELTPCAQRLSEWISEQLDSLKTAERDGEPLNVPRHWIIAMNRQCFKGQHMAVRGMASRLPVSWSSDEFFAAGLRGVDFIEEVPYARWDHSTRWNPHPESYRIGQICTRHMSYVDGCELFDNKVFALAPAECKVMDPQQRVVLENGYEALVRSGYKKGQIINSTGGMYLGFGTGTSDFNFLERPIDVDGCFGATGGSAAITANRFSFCMGMRGPSLSIDAEDAGGMLAIHQGCEGLQKRGRLTVNCFSLVGGIKLVLSPYSWPLRQAMGLMSIKGRSLVCNENADGFVFSDNATNLVLNALTEMIDNEAVVKEYDELIGVCAGTATNHNGRSASISAPNGSAQQEVVSMVVKGAGLSGFDIDAFELYAYGGYLTDAVEVGSVLRVLRAAERCGDPLGLTALKSSIGNQSWATGAMSFARTIMANHWNFMSPNLHLSVINPHIDSASMPMLLVTEVLESRLRSTYTQSMACGFGGTNVSAIAFGNKFSELYRPPAPRDERDRLAFWPGGGGKVDVASRPRKGFFISGTFTQWEPVEMEKEELGLFSYILTLSENRWEQFQIWQDGDPLKCFFPDEPKAFKQTAVQGPSASSGGNAWHIEGRTRTVVYNSNGSVTDRLDGTLGLSASGQAASECAEHIEKVGTVDRGLIGAKYKVRFHIAGKYRMVDWERLSGRPEAAAPPATLEAACILPRSSYHMTADWNGWGIEAMEEETTAARGVVNLSFIVQLLRAGGDFQILRNRDYDQALYPLEDMAGGHHPLAVGGPDEDGEGRAWVLNGCPGDRFRIEFMRSIQGGFDEKRVSWVKLGNEPLSAQQRKEAERTRYAVFGSWDRGARLRGLRWAGQFYHFYVELGDDARASFQLVQEFDWDRIFHPSITDAHPNVKHDVLGPSPGDGRTQGMSWTIGLEGIETAGDIYEVKAYSQERSWSRVVTRVEWSRVPFGTDLSAAEEVGLVLRMPGRR